MEKIYVSNPVFLWDVENRKLEQTEEKTDGSTKVYVVSTFRIDEKYTFEDFCEKYKDKTVAFYVKNGSIYHSDLSALIYIRAAIID